MNGVRRYCLFMFLEKCSETGEFVGRELCGAWGGLVMGASIGRLLLRLGRTLVMFVFFVVGMVFFFFITWYKNIDLSSVRSCGIHRRTLSWEDRTISISKTRLKIPFLESHPDLPGANELSNHCLSNNGWLITTHDVNMDMIIYPCCKCFLSFISVVYFWYNQLWYVGVLFQFRTHQESHLVYPK